MTGAEVRFGFMRLTGKTFGCHPDEGLAIMPELTFTNVLIRLYTGALPLLLALVLPAVVHARVAKGCGDYTAADQGCLTLNPLKHLSYKCLFPLYLY